MKRKTSFTASPVFSYSPANESFVGPRLKHEKTEPTEPTEPTQHLGISVAKRHRFLGGEGYCTKHYGKYQDCPACLETDKANDERRRLAGLHVRPRCDNYHSGCQCTLCVKRWKYKRPSNRAPRCLMCPRPIKRDVGDGMCSLQCKDDLIELQEYPFPGKGPNGEPLFKKTRWAINRGDKL